MSKQTDLILAKQYSEEVETLYEEANYEKAMELSKKNMTLYEK